MKTFGPPLKNPAVIFRQGEDRWASLVNMDTGGSLALNPTGVLVWKLIDGKRDASDVAHGVKAHFGNAPDSVMDDVDSLLNILAQDGFVGYEVVVE